jgi:branched-subunit amino acid transport protein
VTAVLALVLAAAGTYGLRIASVHVAGRGPLSARTQAGLRGAALALIVALAVIDLPRAAGSRLGVTPAVLVGVVTAALVARRKGNLAVVVLAAMAAHELVLLLP